MRTKYWLGSAILSYIAPEIKKFVLYALLRLYVEFKDAGRVLIAPYQMRLAKSGREPDVLFIAKENLARLGSQYLSGPADLAVEVVSPESRGRDRRDKLREYQDAGVREYWIIDPIRREAEFYSLGADGVYQALATGPDGIFRSPVLSGLWLSVNWLWEDPLPKLRVIWKAWGLS